MLQKCLSPVVGLIRKIANLVWKLCASIIGPIMSVLGALGTPPSTTGRRIAPTLSATSRSASKKTRASKGRTKKSQTANTTR